MYGTRGAAQNLGEECAGTMVEAGFIRGNASPCTFYHADRSRRTYVHGDDYVTVGKDADLKWLRKKLEAKYEIKTQVLGPEKEDSQQVKILNRILTLTNKGVEYEADPRHAEIVIKELGLTDAKGVVTPGTKDEGTTKADCEKPLEGHKASEYRAHTARLNYLTTDRPDIAFSVKELARTMSAPTNGCWDKLKRLARYLLHAPRMILKFDFQKFPDKMKTYTDADWAGCKTTRKSTSGGAIEPGGHTIKTWSKTQSLLALS